MNCRTFQRWLYACTSTEQLENIPAAYAQHYEKCAACGAALSEEQEYHAAVQNACTPHEGESFWEDYLSSVMRRAGGDAAKPPTAVRMLKRTLLPAAALALLFIGLVATGRFSPVIDRMLYGEDADLTTMDFIMEEHDQMVSRYMFDTASLYLLDEMYPENDNRTPGSGQGQNVKNR